MRLIKWQSPSLFDSLEDLWGTSQEAGWSPAVDIYENKDSLIIKAELPGIEQDKIDVSVQGDLLTIKGERKKESEVKEENYYRLERVSGSFQRSFTLPANVDATKISAAYKGGILELKVPKAEEAKPKQIKINNN